MIAQLDTGRSGTTASTGALARRLAVTLEKKEVELAVARREISELKHTLSELKHTLSELKRGRELEQNLRRLGEAQAALAHQMRTPLTVAGLHVDQLLLDLKDDAAITRLQKVRTSLGAVERQIRNALVFVTGRLGACTQFGATELIEYLRDALVPLERVHPIVWCVGDLDGLTLDGDRTVLAGAIVNLVENAAAVGGSSVSVAIEVRASTDRLELSVVDDGPGMSRELLARIRVPFVSERTGGTGLGLAIADRVVEAHGGQLTIESRPAEGTRVRIVLPLAARIGS